MRVPHAPQVRDFAQGRAIAEKGRLVTKGTESIYWMDMREKQLQRTNRASAFLLVGPSEGPLGTNSKDKRGRGDIMALAGSRL